MIQDTWTRHSFGGKYLLMRNRIVTPPSPWSSSP